MSMIVCIRSFPVGAELDMNAAAGTKYAWTPKDDFTVIGVRFNYVEAIAAGGMSTTRAAVSLAHSIQGAAEVEKCVHTVTAAQATAGVAIGQEVRPDASFTPFTVVSGDTLNFKVKTQAVGGTVTGQVGVVLICRLNPAGY